MPDPAPGTLAGRLRVLERQIIALRTRISAGVARTDLVADAHAALLAVREIEAMVPVNEIACLRADVARLQAEHERMSDDRR